MLLSQITVDASRYQFRDSPWSEQTVSSIVAEGVDLAKFDPIPITPDADGMYCVAGDGHSRFEAIRRLAADARLPAEWAIDEQGDEWDIPCRVVDRAEAMKLAWTANLSRDNFGPCEEAKVFQAMLGGGMLIEAIARAAHRSMGYVRSMLPLNGLCRTIREQVGRPADAGGVDKYVAQAMAERFARYSVGHKRQQDLWTNVFSRVYLTPKFVRAIIDRLAPALVRGDAAGLLFEMPACVGHALEEMKDRARILQQAQLGMQYLLLCKDSGVLDGFPDLKAYLDLDGTRMLRGIKAMTGADAELIGEMVAA